MADDLICIGTDVIFQVHLLFHQSGPIVGNEPDLSGDQGRNPRINIVGRVGIRAQVTQVM